MFALSNRRRRKSFAQRRSGTTLLELLVVILVLLMITAVTIPVVAPHVEGRRVREGARMLSNFINAGRSRAVETGRAAGVWIERMPNLPEASNMVYFAEIPPVYAGDFLDSTVECCPIGKVTGTNHWPNFSDQEFYNVVIPRNRTSYNTDIWSIPPDENSIGTHQLVRERDLIRFEGIDRLYSLRIVRDFSVPGSQQRNWWYVLKGINATTANPTAYSNEVDARLRYVIRWFGNQNDTWIGHWGVVRSTYKPLQFDKIGLRYQIFRQPVRLQAGSIRLPEGVVVDLNFSSISTDDIREPGTPLHPRSGSTPYIGNAFYPEDNTPVVLVFTPDGRMQRLYCQTKEPSANRWSWDGIEPFGNLFLLVGERRAVIPHETGGTYAEQIKKNWTNLNALWIRVSCQTGFTDTALVDNLSNTSHAANPSSYLYVTRTKAGAARAVGGR